MQKYDFFFFVIQISSLDILYEAQVRVKVSVSAIQKVDTYSYFIVKVSKVLTKIGKNAILSMINSNQATDRYI